MAKRRFVELTLADPRPVAAPGRAVMVVRRHVLYVTPALHPLRRDKVSTIVMRDSVSIDVEGSAIDVAKRLE